MWGIVLNQRGGTKYFKTYHGQNHPTVRCRCRNVSGQDMEPMISLSEPGNAWQGSWSCEAEVKVQLLSHLLQPFQDFTENSDRKTDTPWRTVGGQTSWRSHGYNLAHFQPLRLERIHTGHFGGYMVLTYQWPYQRVFFWIKSAVTFWLLIELIFLKYLVCKFMFEAHSMLVEHESNLFFFILYHFLDAEWP